MCGSLHHHRHHAIVLTELIYFLDTLLDQEFERRHRAECVQNSKVSYVRCLIGRNEKKFDYINPIVKRFRFRSTRVCGFYHQERILSIHSGPHGSNFIDWILLLLQRIMEETLMDTFNKPNYGKRIADKTLRSNQLQKMLAALRASVLIEVIVYRGQMGFTARFYCPGLSKAGGVRRPGAERSTGIRATTAMAASGASEDANARKAQSRVAPPRPSALRGPEADQRCAHRLIRLRRDGHIDQLFHGKFGADPTRAHRRQYLGEGGGVGGTGSLGKAGGTGKRKGKGGQPAGCRIPLFPSVRW
ncbi:hypothetical protein TRIUR3_06891 [Triticum urartu]|uniref:Uncharacterized protein n=1 Tax=Triticum urartu TaxID=4572 RepID=M8A8S3_TRIUA|nr:hypothetical protein TRIUR3_06891 [Triticum urartu]